MKPLKMLYLTCTIVFTAFFIVCIATWFFRPKTQTTAITEAISKAGTAMAIAVETEKTAIEAESEAIKNRSIVRAGKEAVKLASEERLKAHIPLESLPIPVQRELYELLDYVATLETQVWLEVMRGDAWKDSGDAWKEAAEANMELADIALAEIEITKKAAWWKGVRIGSITGVAAIILILVLL